MMEHTPVLLKEVVEIFAPLKGGIFVDATVGSSGHSAAILTTNSKIKNQQSKLQFKNQKPHNTYYILPTTRLIGIDVDQNALELAAENLKGFQNQVTLVHGNFRNIRTILKELKIDKAYGILADLGVSSLQLDDSKRGFSFRHDAPFDMRMWTNSKLKTLNSKQFQNPKIQNFYERSTVNGGQELTAELIIKTWDERKISDALWKYGEERFSRKIAKAIVQNRKNINSTKDLAEICEKCVPPRFRKYKLHPATKTFQALRIAVNDELGALKDFLRDAPECLAPGGRLAIISFHSLEDRLVKQRFNELTRPNYELRMKNYELVTKHPIIANEEEVAQNPRSRSAKLRCIERR